MSITAVAPRFDGGGKITFVEREYRDPEPGELLLRVEANAICGTDRARNDMGFTADGGYGPYEVVHESNFFPVAEDVSAVTDLVPVAQLLEAFELFFAGETAKVVVTQEAS
jgi:hypothetical protein